MPLKNDLVFYARLDESHPDANTDQDVIENLIFALAMDAELRAEFYRRVDAQNTPENHKAFGPYNVFNRL